MTSFVFYIVAILLVTAAIGVMVMRDVFRAGIFLILSFFCVAGIYVLLNADLLAGIQVLVYVGAIGILLMFAIMLTQNIEVGNPVGRLNLPSLLVAVAVLGFMMYVIVAQDWDQLSLQQIGDVAHVPIDGPTTRGIAEALFDKDIGFVLPFEIASVLLLAALIGAVVLVRSKDEK